VPASPSESESVGNRASEEVAALKESVTRLEAEVAALKAEVARISLELQDRS